MQDLDERLPDDVITQHMRAHRARTNVPLQLTATGLAWARLT